MKNRVYSNSTRRSCRIEATVDNVSLQMVDRLQCSSIGSKVAGEGG